MSYKAGNYRRFVMKRNMKKTFEAISLSAATLFMGCNMEVSMNDEEYDNENARVIHGDNWDEVEEDEIAGARAGAAEMPAADNGDANKKAKMAKVIPFEGALTKLSMIGAKKITENMESDAGVAFIESAENVLSGLMKFTDGLLDNYTFGFYKAASGIFFPDEKNKDPEIMKIQKSVEMLQDSVDGIKIQLANINDDLKYEFDGQKVANRIQEIERQKTAFENLFNYLKKIDMNENGISLIDYYYLRDAAVKSFGSVDKMRQAMQNFFTDYYKGNAVATRTYGESYRLIGEELFAWRYQTAEFMETLIAQELEFSSKLFVLAEFLLDPNDNVNMMLDMMIQETVKNSAGAKDLEELIKSNVTAGKNQDSAVFDEIMSILGKYWVIVPTYHKVGNDIVYDENAIDDVEKIRRNLLVRECNVAMDSWNSLVNAFSQYEKTIEAIQIPVDKENEITCNIRGIKCTFSQKISQFDYAKKLSKLAEVSVANKTEENWLKLYKTGCLPTDESKGYARMLSAADYEKILDFYKSHNLAITDSKLCNIVEEGGDIVGRTKKNGGNKKDVTLYNIFLYDAGFDFQNVEAKDAKFACLNAKESMGFILENEREDYGMEGSWHNLRWQPGKCFDGLHFWNVKVPCVKGNENTVECKNELLLGDMAARKGDKTKINRIKYYDDSKVSGTKYLVPNIMKAL